MWELNKDRLNIILRGASVLLAVIVGYYIMKWTLIYLYPFIIALILTLIIHPSVTFVEEKFSIPRPLASASVMILGILLFTGGVFILASEFWQGSAYLAQRLPEYLNEFTQILQKWIDLYVIPLYEKLLSFLNGMDEAQKDTLQNQINQLLSNMSATISGFIQRILLKMPATVSALTMSITVMMIVLLSTFFMTNDWKSIKKTAALWFPQKIKSPGIRIWRSFLQTVVGYFRAQTILVLLSMAMIYIGLTLLGINHALTIALLMAVIDLIPIVGTGFVFIPWILFLFLSEQYPMTIGMSILYMTVVISRQLVEPKILSNHIGINPLGALVGLFVGIQFFGVMGVFITPFFIIIVSTLYQTGVFRAIWQFVWHNDNYLR